MPGQTCAVREVNSYGSYIYQWPSKYDQVFFPHTDEAAIWHCQASGFLALIGDFEGLSQAERIAIGALLKRQPPATAFKEKVALLEQVYALRDKERWFKNRLWRVLARWHQRVGDLQRANALRKQAYDDIVQQLMLELPPARRLEYLYLAANYARLFGDQAASDRRLVELEAALSSTVDPKLSGYANYLRTLAKDTVNIQANGALGLEQ